VGGTSPGDSVTLSDVLVLALDTATPTLVAGLADWSQHGVTEVLAERAVPSGTRHAELLTPAITSVLDDAGLTMGDIDAVVTGLGPGPFTGLRVGVVTAAALADARGLPVIGVCSLDAIGSGARTVVTDARRKEIYWATYDEDGTRIDGPAVVRPEQLGGTGPFVGDPAFAERLDAEIAAVDVTTAGLLRAAAAQLADPASAGPLVPLYLRRPDATPPTAIKAVSQA
jgi:tRNA threonylcarbamoyl adenosine modification protein YeaZ